MLAHRNAGPAWPLLGKDSIDNIVGEQIAKTLRVIGNGRCQALHGHQRADLLNASALAATVGDAASVGHTFGALAAARQDIDSVDARVELRDLRDVHEVSPHGLQGRFHDNRDLDPQWLSHLRNQTPWQTSTRRGDRDSPTLLTDIGYRRMR